MAARRFDGTAIGHALDSRFFGNEEELASQVGVSPPTLRRVRRGQPVDTRTAVKVLQFVEQRSPKGADLLAVGRVSAEAIP